MLIRPAKPSDALAVARVHVRSSQVAYRGLLPDDYLDQQRPEDRAERYDFLHQDPRGYYTLVAVEGEQIYGLATTSPSRDSDLPTYGELCALYVDPEQWGRGVGAALMAAVRQRLAEQGFSHALLWLLAGNARAARFYERDAWTPDGHQRRDTIWGITVDEVRYRTTLQEQSASASAADIQ